MPSATRRQVLKTAAAAAAVAALPRVSFAAETTGKRFIVNDASRLNPTPVYRHWIVGTDEESFFIEHLRRELKDAAAAKRPVAGTAARHTMGGQSIPRDGTAITMQTFRCEPDTRAKTYLVDAGARWHQVISTLDPLGFSPAVMQSNADFGVASTFASTRTAGRCPTGRSARPCAQSS
jgi:FAD/FMN-containing dehydrogenase